jgi:thiamine biosynthesis protein ThiI
MKAVLLVSGGIDSPVAGRLLAEKGIELIGVHFGEESEKVKKLAKNIGIKKLYFVPHDLSGFENSEKRYTCLYCKRLMLRVAEKIAEKEKCEYIVTGENLGQVASQTLDNMFVEDKAVKITILRPLLARDKEETVTMSKKFGTYEISIKEAHECSWLPKSVATKARLEAVEKEEEKANIKNMVEECIKKARVIKVA